VFTEEPIQDANKAFSLCGRKLGGKRILHASEPRYWSGTAKGHTKRRINPASVKIFVIVSMPCQRNKENKTVVPTKNPIIDFVFFKITMDP
tara:strand:+ start:201 stop:473 length:273 start_codon:yes stop_codon:yes gene_type:complete